MVGGMVASAVGGTEEAGGAKEAAATAAGGGDVKSAPVGEKSPTGVAKSAENGVEGAAGGGAGLLGASRSHPAISSPAAHT